MEKLSKLAESEGIFFDYDPLLARRRRLLGLYYFDPVLECPCITLDESLKHDLPLCRSVMAEELGHHFTVPQTSVIVPYTSYSIHMALSRDEARALKWACDFLIPIKEFEKALRAGAESVEELAEYFVVTTWLIRRRVDFYKIR